MTDRIDWRSTGRKLGRSRIVPPDQVIAELAAASRIDVELFFFGYVRGVEDGAVAAPASMVPAILRSLLKGGKR